MLPPFPADARDLFQADPNPERRKWIYLPASGGDKYLVLWLACVDSGVLGAVLDPDDLEVLDAHLCQCRPFTGDRSRVMIRREMDGAETTPEDGYAATK